MYGYTRVHCLGISPEARRQAARGDVLSLRVQRGIVLKPTLRTMVLAGNSSGSNKGILSTGHSWLNDRAAVMQSLQNVCGHLVVAVGFVKGILQTAGGESRWHTLTLRHNKPAYAAYL